MLVQYGEFTVQVIYGDVTGAGFDAIADYLDAQEDCMAGASCATEIEFPI